MTLAEVRTPHVSAHHEASRAADGLHPVPRRILEVLPPALAWAALTSPVWASIFAPELLGYFLIAFGAYWLWRSCEFTAGLLIGLGRLERSRRHDWASAASGLPGYARLHHLVIVPTYKESDEILSETLECLSRQTAPRDRITVVLAFEERDPQAPARAARLAR